MSAGLGCGRLCCPLLAAAGPAQGALPEHSLCVQTASPRGPWGTCSGPSEGRRRASRRRRRARAPWRCAALGSFRLLSRLLPRCCQASGSLLLRGGGVQDRLRGSWLLNATLGPTLHAASLGPRPSLSPTVMLVPPHVRSGVVAAASSSKRWIWGSLSVWSHSVQVRGCSCRGGSARAVDRLLSPPALGGGGPEYQGEAGRGQAWLGGSTARPPAGDGAAATPHDCGSGPSDSAPVSASY